MKTNNSIEEPDWSLMGRYLSGEASDAETKKIEAWAAASEKNQKDLEQNKLLIKGADEFYQSEKFDAGTAWNNVHRRIGSSSDSPGRLTVIRKNTAAAFYRYAAVLIIALLLGSSGYFILSNQNSVKQAEIVSSEREVINDFVLPDGSVVALNSSSKLEYPQKYLGNVREVTITGEVFFDVKPDPERPFIINAGGAKIKVLGTSFNVNASPDAESVEITVKTGVVQVTFREGKNPEEPVELILKEGEKGILHSKNRQLEKSANDDPNYLAWKTHDLIFQKTKLSEVIQDLNTVYYTEIMLDDKELENLVLTARFEDKPAEFILDVIRLTFDLNLTHENGKFILSEKQN